MNARSDRGRKPGIDLAELHVRFGQRDALHAAHFGVGREQQGELRFKGNFERVFAERALPTVHVGLFGSENNFAAFRQRRCFRDGNRLRRTSGDAFSSQAIRGGETPGAVGQHSNAEPDRLALRQSADLAVLGSEITLAQMHDAHIAISSTAQSGGIKGVGAEVPHGRSSS